MRAIVAAFAADPGFAHTHGGLLQPPSRGVDKASSLPTPFRRRIHTKFSSSAIL